MSEIVNNVSYILIPLRCHDKKGFDNLYKNLEGHDLEFIEASFSNDLFYGYIEVLYKKSKHIIIGNLSDEAKEVRLIVFGTRIGFLSVKYLFDNTTESPLELQNEKVRSVLEEIKADKYDIWEKIKVAFPEFVSRVSVDKNVLVYNMFITKISSPESFYMLKNSERVHGIDKLHECYCSSRSFSIVTNQHYKNLVLKETDADSEQTFRDKYEMSGLMMFLLLHHERRAALLLREKIILEKGGKAKEISKIKNAIMDLQSCYSFKIVSEDVEFQKVYSEYRDVLNLSEYESALSELVFRLDDELGKAKEKKITFISLFITLLGLISVVLDIITFID